MADWATFAGVVGVVLVLLLVLARASATVLDEAALSEAESTESTESTESVDEPTPTETEPTESVDETGDTRTDSDSSDEEPGRANAEVVDAAGPNRQPAATRKPDAPPLSTPMLLANVVLSQGVFWTLLVVMAWYTEIPARAFGLSAALTVETVGTGIAVGVLLYGLNEAAAAVARRQGLSTPSTLREALAPETAAGWVILLVVVLPIIAGFEEFLFRGALIGVVHAGFGVSPWLLAVGSSAAFALGHGAQGRLGIVVTGLLGLGLAAAFVLTGSLVVVIVAHYVVNAAEFVVHEGLG